MQENIGFIFRSLQQGLSDSHSLLKFSDPLLVSRRVHWDVVAAVFFGDLMHNFVDGIALGIAAKQCSSTFFWTLVWTTVAHEGDIPCVPKQLHSGKEKEPKPKLFSSDIIRWGRGLSRKGVGAKKFDMSLETRVIKLFWRDIPGFCRDIPEVPEKFEEKKFVFNFRSLYTTAPYFPWTGKSCFSNRVLVKAVFEALKCL